MAVMVEIVSRRVEFSCALSVFVFLCKSVLSFCEVNFGEDFVHQVTRITSRCQACFKVFNVFLKRYFRRVCPPRGGRGGYFQKNWVGVCGPLPKTLTLFMTKICDFSYAIYDLAKTLIPYL